MISDQNFSPLIAEALEELQFNDMEGLCPTLQKLLNEFMLIQREQAIKYAYLHGRGSNLHKKSKYDAMAGEWYSDL